MKYLSLATVASTLLFSLAGVLRADWFLVDGKLVYVQPLAPSPAPWPEPAYKAFLREAPQPVIAKVEPTPAPAKATPEPKATPSPSELGAAKLKATQDAADKEADDRFKAALKKWFGVQK